MRQYNASSARIAGQPFEGAFASWVLAQNLETLAPFASATAGVTAWRAGSGGLLQGRFGWGNADTGLVANAPQADNDILGLVIPLKSVNAANGGVVGGPPSLGGWQASWTWETWDCQYRAWRLRAGLIANLMTRGNFYLRFAGGANYGDPVYASTVDGSAISGSSSGVVTPFTVCANARPCGLAVISSTATFG